MISPFLLEDVPRHDTRLFEVREAFKRTLWLGFRAYISERVANKSPPATLPGGLPGGGSAPPHGPQACCAARNWRRATN